MKTDCRYNPLVLAKVKEFADKHQLSVGLVFYAAMQVKHEEKGGKEGILFNISDQDLYGLLTKALLKANQDVEEEFFNPEE